MVDARKKMGTNIRIAAKIDDTTCWLAVTSTHVVFARSIPKRS